ncbi:MAG: AraC family transcriptional regulator [Chitinophagaceae bacterium]|nr:MAG: AraC family transcriptional regulator [Chitinophagaceae bacterium]
MTTPELPISTINQLYRFSWALEDFLVTDERYTVLREREAFRVDGYIIGICLEGSIELEVDSACYSGGPGSMLIARPLQLLQFLHLSPDCRLRFILFSQRFLVSNNIHQRVLQSFRFSHPAALPVIRITAAESDRIVGEFAHIWGRFNDVQHPFRKEVVGNLLLVLLYDFEAIYRQHFELAGTGRTNELVHRFIDLAQKQFRTQHAVEHYARHLHVTSKYLSAMTKEATGRTAAAFLNELLLLEAQSLLQTAGSSVKEVAHALGFPDQSTFGKFFKRAVGRTPRQYQTGQQAAGS